MSDTSSDPWIFELRPDFGIPRKLKEIVGLGRRLLPLIHIGIGAESNGPNSHVQRRYLDRREISSSAPVLWMFGKSVPNNCKLIWRISSSKAAQRPISFVDWSFIFVRNRDRMTSAWSSCVQGESFKMGVIIPFPFLIVKELSHYWPRSQKVLWWALHCCYTYIPSSDMPAAAVSCRPGRLGQRCCRRIYEGLRS